MAQAPSYESQRVTGSAGERSRVAEPGQLGEQGSRPQGDQAGGRGARDSAGEWQLRCRESKDRWVG